MCLRLSSLTSFMNWPPALRKACWGLHPQTPAFALQLMFYILMSIQSFFFSRYTLRFCYLSALKSAQHLQICLTIDSVILKTICLLLLQVSSNSVQRTLSFIVDLSPNFSTGIHTAQPQNSHWSPIHIPTYTLFYQGHCKLTYLVSNIQREPMFFQYYIDLSLKFKYLPFIYYLSIFHHFINLLHLVVFIIRHYS